MMNKYILLIFLLFQKNIYAQGIKVNEKKYLTLLFETNITSGIVSSDDYVFEYNDEIPDNIALIKAKSNSAEESSLVVKTSNGTIFNINISYGTNKTNIMQVSDSLGINTNISSSLITSNNLKEKNDVKLDLNSTIEKTNIRENDYTIGNSIINDSENKNIECKICPDLLDSKKNIKRILDENYKVKIQINNIYYSNSKLYFVINFINDSDLDYNFNYIKSYVDMGNENKSSSTQYLEKNPVFIYNSNRTIPGNTERKIIFVFDQFSIDNNKKLTIEVNENNGERNLFLKIPHFLINNPKKI